MIKIILITFFLLIIASLGKALFHLVKYKEGDSSEKTVKALTVRIGLSVALFVLVIILVATGIIKPHGIGSRIHPAQPVPNDSAK